MSSDSVKFSCAMIQSIVPAYVNGDASTEQVAMILKHIQHCPACHQLVDTMHGLGRHMHATPDAEALACAFDMCTSIMEQLQQTPNIDCRWTSLFISQYCDGELSDEFSHDACRNEWTLFETHLPQCEPCCNTLHAYQELSRAIRHWYVRSEHALTLDLSETVMHLYQADTMALPACAPIGCGAWSLETASSFLDDECDSAIAVQLDHHLIECIPCRHWVASQRSIQTHVINYYHTLAYQAEAQVAKLNFWSALAPKLQENRSPVYLSAEQLGQRRRRSLAQFIPVGSAVAAIFLGGVLWFSGLLPFGFNAQQSTMADVNPLQMTLASLPASNTIDENSFYDEKAVLLSHYTGPYASPESYIFSAEAEPFAPESLSDATSVAMDSPSADAESIGLNP